MQYIQQKDNTFLLTTQHTALLLQVTQFGHIELLHYGARVMMEDTEALRYRCTMPYGSEVMYAESDESYCLDNLPLAWSGVGKGDYRIPPIEAGRTPRRLR